MTRDQTPDDGEYVMEVDLVKRPQQRNPRRGELEDHEAAPWGEDAECLAKSGVESCHVSDSERDDRTSQLTRGERKLHRIGGDR